MNLGTSYDETLEKNYLQDLTNAYIMVYALACDKKELMCTHQYLHLAFK